MTTFFERLQQRIDAADSLLCVGLDPHESELTERSVPALLAFCKGLVDATHHAACCFKPNAAFFEALGPEGLRALEEVLLHIPADIPVILDCKRGDIGTTAAAYADAYYRRLPHVDCVTLSPYMGRDSIAPFLTDPTKAAIVVCKSSNPGSNDLQTLPCPCPKTGKPLPLYMHVARMCVELGRQHHDNVGLVIGATDADAMRAVRGDLPDVWILAPGVGAQGGDLEAALANGLRADGSGLILPVSRGLSRAKDPRQAADELRSAINKVRHAKPAGRAA